MSIRTVSDHCYDSFEKYLYSLCFLEVIGWKQLFQHPWRCTLFSMLFSMISPVLFFNPNFIVENNGKILQYMESNHITTTQWRKCKLHLNLIKFNFWHDPSYAFVLDLWCLGMWSLAFSSDLSAVFSSKWPPSPVL